MDWFDAITDAISFFFIDACPEFWKNTRVPRWLRVLSLLPVIVLALIALAITWLILLNGTAWWIIISGGLAVVFIWISWHYLRIIFSKSAQPGEDGGQRH